MTLDIYNTHMELYPYKQNDYPILEDMFTATDKMSNTQYPCGYMIEDGKLFLPRGAQITKIQYITRCDVNYIKGCDDYDDMTRNYSPLYDARDKLQEESIEFLCEDTAQLGLNLKTGLGKCEPNSAIIPCPDKKEGFRLMGDIKAGDKVFGSDGKVYTVLQTFPQGIKDIYKITFSDGRVSECGEEHLWDVIEMPFERRSVMQLKDILNDYKTPMGNGHYLYKYHIPSLTEPVEYSHEDVPVDPYTLGAFISSGIPKNKRFTISSVNNHIINRICSINNYTPKCNFDNFSFEFKLSDGKTFAETKDYFYDIKEFLRKGELLIPNEYMINDDEIRSELVRGLFDAKAYPSIDSGDSVTIIYPSSSDSLLLQLQYLLRGMGFIADLFYEDDEHKQLHIRSHQPIRLVKLFTDSNIQNKIIASQSLRIDNNLKSVAIVDIELVREEEATCIMVNSPDHLYLTDDFVVTHNTFCVAYASAKLHEKTIIITPNESLKQQWIKTYQNMIGVRMDKLLNISGSNVIDGIMQGDIPPFDVYFVNHQTLRSYLSANSGYAVRQFFKKIKVGIKVYDESHMEFGNILLIDFFSNTRRTWYLTATFDRTDKSESVCFKRAFSSVSNFGYNESIEIVEKHVVYHVVNINSHIDPKNRAKLMGYPAFTASKYGQYAIFDDPNNTVYKAILEILNKCKNMEGKTLIFLPLIDAVDEVVKRLKKDFPDKTVAPYHSKISKSEKDDSEKKDIIVSTIKSCGTGRDIKGLRCIICAEPVASKVVIEQTIGRLRPYAKGMDTYYFDLVDRSILPINWWFNARFKKIEGLVKEVLRFDL